MKEQFMLEETRKGEIDSELVKRANEGDDKAMSELIVKISPAAVAKGKKLSSGNFRASPEDLAQEGMIGFLYAVRNFDPSRGVPFEAFADRCIENRIKAFLRASSGSGNEALSSALNIIDDDQTGEELRDPVNGIGRREEEIDVKAFVEDNMSELEQKVISLRLDGMTYSEIADELGCTEKAVDNAIQRIRKKYREKKNQAGKRD